MTKIYKSLASTIIFGLFVFALTIPGLAKANVPANEEQIILGYIASSPDLPKKTEKSPADVSAIMAMFDISESADKVSGIYPYLSSRSIEMLQQAPSFYAELQKDSYSLYKAKSQKPKIKILKGLQYAIASGTTKQSLTGFTESHDVVFIKENGVWKIDLVGSVKLLMQSRNKANPRDLSVKGSGKTDLSLTGMNYEQASPIANDSTNKFLFKVKNNGKTTIYHFNAYMEINGTDVFQDEIYFTLKPKKEVIVSLPTSAYWALPGVNKSAGQYETNLAVSVTPYDLDQNNSDNYFTDTTTFR